MDSNNEVQDSEYKSKSFPIVAIGAAAGGVDALEELLHYLPGQTGMAYIYIQNSEDVQVTEIVNSLSKTSKIPVKEGKEGERIIPDYLYILPPGKTIRVEDNIIKPEDQDEILFAVMPVNQVFSSLAEVYKEATIGVILSGSDSDGALGLKAIKQAGGLTFVQDHSASFKSMPRNASLEGVADLVLSPREIAEELTRISRQKEIYFTAIQELNEETISNQDEDLLAILRTLKKSTGVDFSQYKMKTIKRRIIRRIMLHKLETLKNYVQYLRNHTGEIGQLYQDLLINVTYFFRDIGASDYLRDQVLPQLIRQKTSNDSIRVWVPACSTGQEAYSLAMLIIEMLGENAMNLPVQIFATDLSELAINKARLGVYSKDEVVGISPRRLQRFFTKIDGSYRIIKSIRDLCVFATHNIAKDPPFSHLDLISCCNLLIYLENHLQKKLIATFHYSLNKNGYLVLGKSETIGTSSYLFTQVDKKFKIYSRKKDAASKAVFEMNLHSVDHERSPELYKKSISQKNKPEEQDIDKAIDTVLMKKYTPATVVVNGELDILQFRGSTGLYLEPSPGKASLNLMKMARQGLGFELRNIVHKAKKTGEPVRKTGLEITVESKPHRLAIEAIPVKGEAFDDYFLVVFEPMPAEKEDGQTETIRDKRVKQLEAELNALREDMRSIIEAQEAANEELQSANEEIVSSNEELQSINEELETSKEEIESSNEELITINQELQIRNEQLAEALEYSEAVFTTIRESLLILDKDFRVKSANNAFYQTFNTREEDTEGRILFDIQNRQLDIPELRELLENILPKNNHYHGFEIVHNFPGIGEKVLLFNARKVLQKSYGQELILLAIEDITEHRQAQKLLAERESWFRNMADNAPVMIWVVDGNKASSFLNKAWLEFRGLKLEEATGKNWYDGIHPDDLENCLQEFNTCFDTKTPFEVKYRSQRSDGVYRWLLNRAKPNFSGEHQFLGYIGFCVDTGEEK